MQILEIVQALERFERGYVAAVTDEEYADAVAAARDLIIQQGDRIADLELRVDYVLQTIKTMVPTFTVNVDLLQRCCAELTEWIE